MRRCCCWQLVTVGLQAAAGIFIIFPSMSVFQQRVSQPDFTWWAMCHASILYTLIWRWNNMRAVSCTAFPLLWWRYFLQKIKNKKLILTYFTITGGPVFCCLFSNFIAVSVMFLNTSLICHIFPSLKGSNSRQYNTKKCVCACTSAASTSVCSLMRWHIDVKSSESTL